MNFKAPKHQSTKLLFKFLIALVIIFNYSCDKDKDEIVDNQSTDIGEIEYGITLSELLNSTSYQNVNIYLRENNNINQTSRTDSLASQLTTENLIERLDLEKSHLNIYDNKEVLTAPIKTNGNYKRALLTLTEDGYSNSYLLTYPNPDDNTVYYVSTLNGILLQKTVIGSDGIGNNEIYNSLNGNNTSTRSGSCYNIVYQSCSPSGAHGYSQGNANECTYWDPENTGTPPSYTYVEVQCITTSGGQTGGTSGTSGGNSGNGGTSGGGTNDGDGFQGVPPIKGGFSDVDECVSNLDCDTCNLGVHDVNGDCDILPVEMSINNINNCLVNGTILPNGLTPTQKQTLYNNPSIAFNAEGALTITCNQDAQQFLADIIDEVDDGDEVNFDDLIILDSTFVNNQKLKCIYDKLKGLDNTLVKDIVNNLFGSPNTSNIKISVGSIPPQMDANTFAFTSTKYIKGSEVPFEQGKIKQIRINSNLVENTSSLEIARMLIHEIIHAELMSRCIDLGFIEQTNIFGGTIFVDNPNLYTLSEIVFNLLLIEYNAYEPANSSNANPEWNHDLFNALNYRNKLAQDLLQIHPQINDVNNDFLTLVNNSPNLIGGEYTISQVMDYISWIGLEGTEDYMNNILNNTEELYRKNFVEILSRNDYNKNCNN